MKIEHQVVSLDLARQLKELGVREESLFVWVCDVDGKIFVDSFKCWEEEIKENGYGNTDLDRVFYPAYTSAELGEMLPDSISKDDISYTWIEIGKVDNKWSVLYRAGCAKADYEEEADTLADAMAKMLIYLLQNDLITNK